MKRHFPYALSLALLVPSQGRADESLGQEKANPIAPLASPWDANAWEAGSGQAFWRGTRPRTDSGSDRASAAPSTSAPPSSRAPDSSRRRTEK